jgi:hypothetical protein
LAATVPIPRIPTAKAAPSMKFFIVNRMATFLLFSAIN